MLCTSNVIYYSVVIEKNSCAIEMTISAICTVTVCNDRDISAKKIQVKKKVPVIKIQVKKGGVGKKAPGRNGTM